MTGDEMDICEALHRASIDLYPDADALLGIGFNPVNEIDDIVHEMATREADALDWYAVYSIVQRTRRWVARLPSGEPAQRSG
jgi:hypothetical protein